MSELWVWVWERPQRQVENSPKTKARAQGDRRVVGSCAEVVIEQVAADGPRQGYTFVPSHIGRTQAS